MSAIHDTPAAAARTDGRALPWLALAALCAAGGVVGTASMLVPLPADADVPALWVNIALAFAASAVAFVCGRRHAPLWPTHLVLIGGTYLVTNAVYRSGDRASHYAVWYTWIALYAFSFYGRAAASAHVAVVAGAYAGVLAVRPAETSVGRWITTVATVLIAATFVDQLVRRLKRGRAAVQELMLQLAEAAQTDELTGLANRRSWQAAVERELAHARRFGVALAVAVVDLDRFKQLNDARGHQAGDTVLRDAARAWSEVVRDVDTLARWGGDEFGLLAPGCGADEACLVAERIRASTPEGMTCSIGVVVWDGAEDGASLVARADDALYRAKRDGRNRVVVDAGDAARPVSPAIQELRRSQTRLAPGPPRGRVVVGDGGDRVRARRSEARDLVDLLG